ncbi:hypothetical protein DEO72_LG2g3291 [Vigna unguiculata]|uniref:Uncharacterized protein n=1 Tax=Vigna unguiculata TaxID=3917 RepID=A0A4D6L375_VIGUN|nr:hypothetical protein DEO72_LG2g3290 [Vigna unguiculata]QCD82949.1 hypothetical protein DEO72_LG2g3291 [Vigna unguiculata]
MFPPLFARTRVLKGERRRRRLLREGFALWFLFWWWRGACDADLARDNLMVMVHGCSGGGSRGMRGLWLFSQWLRGGQR